MTREIQVFVQAELQSYHDTKQEMDTIRDDIAETEAMDIREERRKSEGSIDDPTPRKTHDLMTNKRLKRMSDTVRAIEVVFRSLPPEKKRLVKMKYWDRQYTDYGIARELFISDRTLRRWDRVIIRLIAQEMGLV